MGTQEKMPVLFAGHGSPMNAVDKTVFGELLAALGPQLPRPRCILVISAHWQTAGSQVVGSERPQIIHDFYGFPERLFQLDYPAQGSPEMAKRIAELIPSAKITKGWGLDHGSWSVLVHLYNKADIPVLQMSLDETLTFEEHYKLAQSLKPLREEGVLIVGSGNIVHNLREMQRTSSTTEAPAWAMDFDTNIANALMERDSEKLIHIKKHWPKQAALSVPTAEHYLPLLYTAALSELSDTLTFPITGFQLATISMRTALWTPKKGTW
jgi:4,5-DOPA dioxygenase extradiol